MLVGNKTDLSHAREISREEGERVAKQYGLMFVESSAKTNDHVDMCFWNTAERIYELVQTGQIDTEDPDSGVKRRHVDAARFAKLNASWLRSPSNCCSS